MKSLEEKIKETKEKVEDIVTLGIPACEQYYISELRKYIKLLEKQIKELKKAIKITNPMTEIGIELYNRPEHKEGVAE